jgi:hypothetical protein
VKSLQAYPLLFFRCTGATTRVAPTNRSVGATLVVALFEINYLKINKEQKNRNHFNLKANFNNETDFRKHRKTGF